MNVIAVESSTLATIAYDGNRELLQLEFNSRAVYQYLGVPAVVYEELLHAPSKGSYFNQAIRGKFPYRQIPSGPTGAPGLSFPAGHRR
jgi:hypothetical protein